MVFVDLAASFVFKNNPPSAILIIIALHNYFEVKDECSKVKEAIALIVENIENSFINPSDEFLL
uniref:Uncharacterized protein n=1 Tax=Rhizophora mucronata TaxID=61149 RepID=A0A2P2MV01_RHIMU